MVDLIWKDEYYPKYLWDQEKKIYSKTHPHVFNEVHSLDFIEYPNFIDFNITKILKFELLAIRKTFCIDIETLEHIEI